MFGQNKYKLVSQVVAWTTQGKIEQDRKESVVYAYSLEDALEQFNRHFGLAREVLSIIKEED